ncbi:BppU family phage baseplate upper protein [Vagococcus carniphilus]|uniref:BppU family phage baseplate upper protein n=1 Tax=Vagococcus carniphilus TaxID=218144 RepID=UPI00288CA058|nr:BppU family phage baseplate upper protein [Vagococcus carniphilus]MDT2813737.1 BppU family phage baseplate upper protein [Vagococcus carniphilus]
MEKNRVNYNLELSVTEDLSNKLIKIRQSDDETQIFNVELTENAEVRGFEGLTPFFCLFPRGTTGQGLTEEPVQEFDGKKGILRYTLSSNAWQYVGRNEAYFSFRKQLLNGEWDEQFSTKMFVYQVEKSIYQIKFRDSNYWWTFKELKRQFQGWIDSSKNYWENFLVSVKDTIESIDGGGSVLEVSEFKFSKMLNRWFKTISERAELWDLSIFDLGINVRWFGAKGDGITDDTEAIKKALAFGRNVKTPPGKIYRITEQINLRQGQSLIGMTSSRRNYGNASIILYDGPNLEKDTVILLGKNKVGEKPISDGTDLQLENLLIDCNYKAAHGVYGTYLTNESKVKNVTVIKSNEIAIYAASCWYAEFEDLSALNNRNNGIMLGLPLIYSDGTFAEWTSVRDLQMNNCSVDNIRSNFAGEMFKDVKYDINEHSKMGIGVAIGLGYSFNVNTFLSENSGGINLYILSSSDVNKYISKGYLEKTMVYRTDLSNEDKCGILLETQYSQNYSTKLADIYVNANTSGGIYHKGTLGGKFDLINIHQPAFLKSLDGVDERTLSQTILKDNVHYKCGYYNDDPKFKVADSVSTVNSRYSFEIDIVNEGTRKEIWVKKLNNKHPWGSLIANSADGSSTPMTIPSSLTNNKYVLVGITTASVISISKGGATGEEDRDMKIKVISLIPTYY